MLLCHDYNIKTGKLINNLSMHDRLLESNEKDKRDKWDFYITKF